MCVEDTGATCAKLGALFGMEAKEPMPGVSVFGLPHGNVYVLNRMVLPDGRRESSRLTCRMSLPSASA